MKIIKYFITILFAALFSESSFSQVKFQKFFSAQNIGVSYLQQTNDSGYILIATTFLFGVGNRQPVLIKTDVNGTILWSQKIGDGYGRSVYPTNDGGYIVAGGNGFNLSKMDGNGNLTWSKGITYSTNLFPFCVKQTTDNGFIISGYSQGPVYKDVYILKTDSTGNVLWSNIFPGGIGYSVAQTTDGGYIIGGEGHAGVYLIKTDSAGSSVWKKSFALSNSENANCVQQTADGGYILAGKSGTSTRKVYVIKTDPTGSLMWSKTYHGAGNADDEGRSIIQTADKGFIIGAVISTSAAGIQACLLKTDSIGNVVWGKSYGGLGDGVYCVQQANDHGFIAGVSIGGGLGNGAIYIIKTDSLGNSGCNENNISISTNTPLTQETNPITVDSSGGISASNAPNISSLVLSVSTVCISVGIDNVKAEAHFIISPNPTAGNFTISFSEIIRTGIIELYNTLGKKLYSEKINNESKSEISLETISQGIYFVKVSVGEKSYCKKIIIEHD